jgi:hypothetical protein
MIPLNRKKKFTCLPTVIMASLILSSCSVRVADLTLVSTKNIDLSDMQLDTQKGLRQTGEDCHFNFLGLIPFGLPNMKEAVDEALEKGKGNVMVDEVTEYKNIWIVIGFISCIDVEGTVLNARHSADFIPPLEKVETKVESKVESKVRRKRGYFKKPSLTPPFQRGGE